MYKLAAGVSVNNVKLGAVLETRSQSLNRWGGGGGGLVFIGNNVATFYSQSKKWLR